MSYVYVLARSIRKNMNHRIHRNLNSASGAAHALLLALALAVAGCAAQQGGQAASDAAASVVAQTPEQLVAARANARWKALVARDFQAAYGFASPGYRALTSVEGYTSRRGTAVKWIGAQAVKVECSSAERCVATVRIQAQPFLGTRFGDTITTHVEETWVRESDQWWIAERL
ncbi:hypothetical protein PY257_14645 [Ramlibacter sp. H39-3-26]|uniref:hypothetical protein n=1 Tax=Curvibacter soli TaxID=3031331 RepID=UPI0023DB3E88|nr:hypothetical protein [Ramlibacter sp. H39-3-26]MDF1486401.1 hypothetical protein [Ramlibacter sp. H39-3-26]